MSALLSTIGVKRGLTNVDIEGFKKLSSVRLVIGVVGLELL